MRVKFFPIIQPLHKTDFFSNISPFFLYNLNPLHFSSIALLTFSSCFFPKILGCYKKIIFKFSPYLFTILTFPFQLALFHPLYINIYYLFSFSFQIFNLLTKGAFFSFFELLHISYNTHNSLCSCRHGSHSNTSIFTGFQVIPSSINAQQWQLYSHLKH